MSSNIREIVIIKIEKTYLIPQYIFEPSIPIEPGNAIHNQNMYLKFDAFSFRSYKKHQAKNVV